MTTGDSPASHEAVDRVASQILDYVRRHTEAADSLRGIRDWWLDTASPHPSLPTVERAVLRLVGAGLLRRDAAADGIVVYSAGFDPAWPLKRVS